MTLGFTTKINGKPTFFVEKIWEGFVSKGLSFDITPRDFKKYISIALPGRYKFNEHKPKLHTIRADEKNRWAKGKKIHFVTGNRTKYRLQFAPVVLVKCVQEIKVKHISECDFAVYVDGKHLAYPKLKELYVNDGFESLEDFKKYFSKDFEGKIIHWTDFKY